MAFWPNFLSKTFVKFTVNAPQMSIKTTPSLLQQADINSHDAFNLLLSLWLDPSLLSEVGAQRQSSFKKVNYFASQFFLWKAPRSSVIILIGMDMSACRYKSLSSAAGAAL